MHYYLIDFENVGPTGLNGLKLPGEEAEIRIFLSNAAHFGTEEIREDILESKAKIETFFCTSKHKNAMDFEIAAYAGAVLERADTERVSVISADNGYAILEDYTRRMRKDVVFYQAKNIIEAYVAGQHNICWREYKTGQNVEFKKIMDELRRRRHCERTIQTRMKGLPEEEVKKAVDIYHNSKPGREMYFLALHEFGRTRGTEFYRLLKKLHFEMDGKNK